MNSLNLNKCVVCKGKRVSEMTGAPLDCDVPLNPMPVSHLLKLKLNSRTNQLQLCFTRPHKPGSHGHKIHTEPSEKCKNIFIHSSFDEKIKKISLE